MSGSNLFCLSRSNYPTLDWFMLPIAAMPMAGRGYLTKPTQ